MTANVFNSDVFKLRCIQKAFVFKPKSSEAKSRSYTHIISSSVVTIKMNKLKSIPIDQIKKSKKQQKKDTPYLPLSTETDLNLCSYLSAVFILQTNKAF